MTKITKFPQGLDTSEELPDINQDDRMNKPEVLHDVQHTRLNQAVIELQKKIGADESADENSIDYRLRDIEENGSGGQGLEPLEDDNPFLTDFNEAQTIPAHPSRWFMIEYEGETYAVPAFKVKKLEPPTEVEGGTAMVLAPTGVLAAEYIPFYEE